MRWKINGEATAASESEFSGGSEVVAETTTNSTADIGGGVTARKEDTGTAERTVDMTETGQQHVKSVGEGITTGTETKTSVKTTSSLVTRHSSTHIDLPDAVNKVRIAPRVMLCVVMARSAGRLEQICEKR